MSVTTEMTSRLADAIGAKRVITAMEELASFAVDDLIPSAIVRPDSAEEVAEAVRFALAEKLAIVPLGSRSVCDMGMRPGRYDIALDMTALRGIAHYDPGDLTLSVDAGLPLRELEICLKQKGQFLPLAVPCFESATAGGAVVSGIDSAFRMQYGTVRDFLIGAEFVDGTGQLCKSGGRVVKNVTGYDLHKLLIGSQGTLGVVTRVNFRTFPLPESSGGHLAGFANIEAALQYRNVVEKSGLPLANLEGFSPSAAEMISAILHRSGEAFPEELRQEMWWVYSAFEGSALVVERIGRELEKISLESCVIEKRLLAAAEDEALGGMLREAFEWLRWASPANAIFRLALPEAKAKTFADLFELAGSVSLRPVLLLRAAGIVYFGVLAQSDEETTSAALMKIDSGVRSIASAAYGHVALLHAPVAVKRKIAETREKPANLAMERRVKQAFDPSGIFAPGRIVGGI